MMIFQHWIAALLSSSSATIIEEKFFWQTESHCLLAHGMSQKTPAVRGLRERQSWIILLWCNVSATSDVSGAPCHWIWQNTFVSGNNTAARFFKITSESKFLNPPPYFFSNWQAILLKNWPAIMYFFKTDCAAATIHFASMPKAFSSNFAFQFKFCPFTECQSVESCEMLFWSWHSNRGTTVMQIARRQALSRQNCPPERFASGKWCFSRGMSHEADAQSWYGWSLSVSICHVTLNGANMHWLSSNIAVADRGVKLLIYQNTQPAAHITCLN